ncbi:gluconate 2-dehydrogenase subunit 3 family protein [Planococcus sp. YIM B11945]|uniref:gluconate 2-dehydrogenase subunit 3 family protein n=1 Tax=Planococcus sp. YIM B11945 TaxID=3435410 RepID=UPI003D7E4449
MPTNQEKDQEKIQSNSRRTFLKNSGLTVGGLVLGGALGGLLKSDSASSSGADHSSHTATATTANFNQALMYLDKTQFDTIEAAAEQIFPKTDIGPGAKELLVAYYIDHQLAGNWGLNTKEYMAAPFKPNQSVPEMGYQGHLRRQEIFSLGIEALNKESNKRFKSEDGKKTLNFYELEAEQQIEILKDFEADKVKVNGAFKASYFFSLLRKATIEGVYADPLYGGNKDMQGWKMKNFPGHQMNMKEAAASEKLVTLKPQSLNSQHKH